MKKLALPLALLVAVVMTSIAAYSALQWLRYEQLYGWHRLRYHELVQRDKYRQLYPVGTTMAKLRQQEKIESTYELEGATVLNVEPDIEGIGGAIYCGFNFSFRNGKLVAIEVGSPCH